MSHLDKQVIAKSDKNIIKLLKKIDKQSSGYVDWVKRKEDERIKAGISNEDQEARLGK